MIAIVTLLSGQQQRIKKTVEYKILTGTRSSAVAERPRDALYH